MATYSEEDLATLTPEERAVILDDDGAAEANAKALAKIAGEDDDDEDDEDGDTGDAGQVDAEVIDVKFTEKETAPVVAEKAAAPEREEKFRPTYQADVPADIDQRLSGIDTDIDALTAQFKAGDIDFDEHQAQTRALEATRRDLSNAKTKAEISREMSTQAANQEWQFTVKSFMKNTAKDGGTDYQKDPVKHADLDSFVKILAHNPAHEGRDQEWFLHEAHKRVNALHGVAQAASKTPIADAKAARKVDLSNAPKSLSQVPGSDGPGDIGDEFASIDALSGDKLEQAIARMSPAQRDKYMSQA